MKTVLKTLMTMVMVLDGCPVMTRTTKDVFKVNLIKTRLIMNLKNINKLKTKIRSQIVQYNNRNLGWL